MSRRALALVTDDADALDGDGGAPDDAASWALRMKDLCDATGLSRQVVHFYIKEGLLPAGRKTGRTMAYYGDVHVERLRLIQRLQHERFLPLRAIKALFDGGGDHFTPEQQGWLREVKRRVATTLARGSDRPELLPVAPLLAAHGLTAADLADLEAAGVLTVGAAADGTPVVAADDAWVFDNLGELRRLGFTEERGFTIADTLIYERFVSALFDEEVGLIASRLSRLDADEAARMVEQVLPLVHRFITNYHEAKIRRFFAALE